MAHRQWPVPLPEVWLRGPLPEFAAALQPVAHSLLQIREEIEPAILPLSNGELWARPGGAASVGFHLRHLAGSLDRLLTYARGEELTEAQRKALDAEQVADSTVNPAALLDLARQTIDRALDQIRATPVESLFEARRVGRSRLPSTVVGLLFHAAEHAQRHAGQIATTARIVRALHRSELLNLSDP